MKAGSSLFSSTHRSSEMWHSRNTAIVLKTFLVRWKNISGHCLSARTVECKKLIKAVMTTVPSSRAVRCPSPITDILGSLGIEYPIKAGDVEFILKAIEEKVRSRQGRKICDLKVPPTWHLPTLQLSMPLMPPMAKYRYDRAHMEKLLYKYFEKSQDKIVRKRRSWSKSR